MAGQDFLVRYFFLITQLGKISPITVVQGAVSGRDEWKVVT